MPLHAALVLHLLAANCTFDRRRRIVFALLGNAVSLHGSLGSLSWEFCPPHSGKQDPEDCRGTLSRGSGSVEKSQTSEAAAIDLIALC